MSDLVISLSSIPPRFGKIGETLQSLLAQTADVDRILLYIPERYRRFPDWDGTLPEVPDGVEIRRTETDFGPATKALGAVRDFATSDCRILFCDDDRAYPPDWAARFLALEKRRPGTCLCTLGMHAYLQAGGSRRRALQPRAVRRWRVTDVAFQLRYLRQDLRAGRRRREIPQPARRVFRRSGYVDIFEGCGGVLVRPAWFDDTAFDIPDVAWGVDDVWLSAMIARKDIPIWLEAGRHDPRETAAEAHAPLARTLLGGADRKAQNRAAIAHVRERFGIWP